MIHLRVPEMTLEQVMKIMVQKSKQCTVIMGKNVLGVPKKVSTNQGDAMLNCRGRDTENVQSTTYFIKMEIKDLCINSIVEILFLFFFHKITLQIPI